MDDSEGDLEVAIAETQHLLQDEDEESNEKECKDDSHEKSHVEPTISLSESGTMFFKISHNMQHSYGTVTEERANSNHSRVTLSDFDQFPVCMNCPYCRQEVETVVFYQPGRTTWAACGALAILTCCLCCWIPFFVDALKDARHECPKCGNVMGKYQYRMRGMSIQSETQSDNSYS